MTSTAPLGTIYINGLRRRGWSSLEKPVGLHDIGGMCCGKSMRCGNANTVSSERLDGIDSMWTVTIAAGEQTATGKKGLCFRPSGKSAARYNIGKLYPMSGRRFEPSGHESSVYTSTAGSIMACQTSVANRGGRQQYNAAQWRAMYCMACLALLRSGRVSPVRSFSRSYRLDGSGRLSFIQSMTLRTSPACGGNHLVVCERRGGEDHHGQRAH